MNDFGGNILQNKFYPCCFAIRYTLLKPIHIPNAALLCYFRCHWFRNVSEVDCILHWIVLTIGVRGGRAGGGSSHGLEKFQGKLCFQGNLYFSTVKNSRATLFFMASASCSKILNNKKYTFNTANSAHPLFFRASASC